MLSLMDVIVAQLEHVHAVDGKIFPGTTYETLEAMLIAVSPGYVQAMGTEVGERLKGYGGESREGESSEPTTEEIKIAEGGEGWGR